MGISYNGEVAKGQPDWSGITNIKVLDFEKTITLQVCIYYVCERE